MQSIKSRQRPSTCGLWKHKTAAAKSQEGQSIWKRGARQDLISSSIPQVSFAWLRIESWKENGWEWDREIYKVKDVFYCSGIYLECPLIWLCWMDHMASSPSSVHWGVTESLRETDVLFIYDQSVIGDIDFDCSGCLKERRERNLQTFIYSFVNGLLWLTIKLESFLWWRHGTHRSVRKWSINITLQRQQHCWVKERKALK